MAVRIMMRRFRFDNAALADVRRHAEHDWPMECCGLLVGRRDPAALTIRAAQPCANVCESNAQAGYVIDPEALLSSLRHGGEQGECVVGFYHSHPAGPAVPSRRDLAEAWAGMAYLIVGMRGGRAECAIVWEAAEDGHWTRPHPLDSRARLGVT